NRLESIGGGRSPYRTGLYRPDSLLSGKRARIYPILRRLGARTVADPHLRDRHAPLVGRHDSLGARDDFGWRLVEPVDQRLYVDALYESELKVHLGALRDKLRVP